ncbi:MAG: RNA polymerase subunit sigma [Marinilabiliales bacterium]|nr:MAG: RNA polymerase subunit sigma [Marinilabiliales bacterium]
MAEKNHPDIAVLVEKYAADLLKRAMYKVSDVEIAKDIVQDTFLAATEKIHNFKGESSPKTWLFSILNFKIIDYYRAKSRQNIKASSGSLLNFFDESGGWKENKMPQSWEEHENILNDPDFQHVLRNCLESLPENWAACVRMKYFMGKKGAEICQDLEITSTNLWQMIHRAKLNLRNCIETNWHN